jgi:hypothetical protein
MDMGKLPVDFEFDDMKVEDMNKTDNKRKQYHWFALHE